MNKKTWKPFEEAREFARSLKLKNKEAWCQYAKTDERPDDIPSTPRGVYLNKGWKGWVDWLGTEWKPFDEAREFARSLKLRNGDEWNQYCKSGERPNDIPSHPYKIYKNDGWIDWFDWLGTDREWRPFDEARDFVRSLQLKNMREWRQYSKSNKKPDDIPSAPNIIYKNDGWNGWINWLGNEDRIREPISDEARRKMSEAGKQVWKPFEEARDFARSLNLKSSTEWNQYCKSGERPDDIPSTPERTYKNDGWKGMGDWLGTEWKPFEDARVFVRSLKLRGAEEWEEYRKSGKRPNDIPSNPDKIYKNDGWISIPDWLGNEPMKGRKLSEEHRRKIGEAWKNRESVSDRTKRKMSDSHREAQNRPEQKERVSKWRANLKIPRKDTNPEIILQEICKDADIEFVTQKVIKLQRYDWHAHGSTFVDVFIEPNICLFADGDYWHANPNPYMVNKRIKPGIKPDTVLLSSSKQKRIAKDVREKDAGISLDLMQQGYIVIRFWESDLKYDKEKCRQEVIDVVRKSKE